MIETGLPPLRIPPLPPLNFAKASLNWLMYYTYILRSIKTNGAIYIGYTTDLKSRLEQHNNPKSKFYSRRHSPWAVESYIGFANRHEAENFETYLKSNSGKAFLRKRLISNQFKEALAKFNNSREKKVSETQ